MKLQIKYKDKPSVEYVRNVTMAYIGKMDDKKTITYQQEGSGQTQAIKIRDIELIYIFEE